LPPSYFVLDNFYNMLLIDKRSSQKYQMFHHWTLNKYNVSWRKRSAVAVNSKCTNEKTWLFKRILLIEKTFSTNLCYKNRLRIIHVFLFFSDDHLYQTFHAASACSSHPLPAGYQCGFSSIVVKALVWESPVSSNTLTKFVYLLHLFSIANFVTLGWTQVGEVLLNLSNRTRFNSVTRMRFFCCSRLLFARYGRSVMFVIVFDYEWVLKKFSVCICCLLQPIVLIQTVCFWVTVCNHPLTTTGAN